VEGTSHSRMSGKIWVGGQTPGGVFAMYLDFAISELPAYTSTSTLWGAVFAANPTSDSTGIGTWKDERFIYAIRSGKYDGMASDRNILSVMPKVMYRNMIDKELIAIFASLKSTKPIKNKVPPLIPPIKNE